MDITNLQHKRGTPYLSEVCPTFPGPAGTPHPYLGRIDIWVLLWLTGQVCVNCFYDRWCQHARQGRGRAICAWAATKPWINKKDR